MKNITKRQFVPLILSCFLLISCQGNNPAMSKSTATNATSSHEDMGGTDSTGGGNGVNGKPLDFYIERDIENKPYYVDHILPLMKDIYPVFPRLAADFYHLTHQRDWYFVPIKLKEISRKILGTYGKTDQLALQDLNKIWIDSNQFDQMDENSQATLVIHEIVMGIRLMKYKNKQDHCLSKAALVMFEESSDKSYNDRKRMCRKYYPLPNIFQGDTKFDLNRDDYDLIRKIVALLDRANPDVEEVKELIESTNLRDYND